MSVDPQDTPPDTSITPARLTVGVLLVEQRLDELERLVTAHLDGSQPTTRDATEAAVVSFLHVHNALTQDVLRFVAELTPDTPSAPSDAPESLPESLPGSLPPSLSAVPPARMRAILDGADGPVLERCLAGQQTLEYLREASQRGQRLAARMREARNEAGNER